MEIYNKKKSKIVLDYRAELEKQPQPPLLYAEIAIVHPVRLKDLQVQSGSSSIPCPLTFRSSEAEVVAAPTFLATEKNA